MWGPAKRRDGDSGETLALNPAIHGYILCGRLLSWEFPVPDKLDRLFQETRSLRVWRKTTSVTNEQALSRFNVSTPPKTRLYVPGVVNGWGGCNSASIVIGQWTDATCASQMTGESIDEHGRVAEIVRQAHDNHGHFSKAQGMPDKSRFVMDGFRFSLLARQGAIPRRCHVGALPPGPHCWPWREQRHNCVIERATRLLI
jgi:hypothetical protein